MLFSTTIFLLFSISHSVPARVSTIWKNCTRPGMDGPIVSLTNFPALATGDHLTFFINGYNWVNIMDPRYGANVKAAYAKGHQIGNHGWNHLSSTDCATMNPNECPNGDLTNPQVYNQIKSLNDVLFNIIGKVPNFFRPPYGQFDSDTSYTQGLALDAGIDSIGLWNVDSGDTDNGSNSTKVLAYLKSIFSKPGVGNATNSFVIVMHEQVTFSITEVTTALIPFIKNLGYKLVTLAECTNGKPYQTGIPAGTIHPTFPSPFEFDYSFFMQETRVGVQKCAMVYGIKVCCTWNPNHNLDCY